MIENENLAWRKASRCESNGCVEVARNGAEIAMRDSKDPDGPLLSFSREAWYAFLAGIKGGEPLSR